MTVINLKINDKDVTCDIEDRMNLADFLRDSCNLTATHLGCEHGACGACGVLVDGTLTRSCLKFAVQCDARHVTTLEGLDHDAVMNALREGFHHEHGLQCGFCTPGMLMAARDLLLRNPKPDEQDIREALAGNLCRCTGYAGIVRAVTRASKSLSDQTIKSGG